jgi:stage II sporulation SpoE-like protein/ANTAR domain-containing protein
VTAPDPGEIGRLTALASWQRGELDRLRAQAAACAVVERATGMLMERLGCPAADARQQLARLAADTGVSQADIAADIAGESLAVAAESVFGLLDGLLDGPAERLAALLEQAQWLGRTGGWEENLVTGEVNWAAPTFSLFGLPPGRPVRLADLDQHVPTEDVPAVRAFRDRLTRQAGAVTAAFRIIRADDASVRQLRAFAQPAAARGGTVVAVRGAYQDVSAQYHTQVAFAAAKEQLAGTEEWAREEHELAVRLQQAITPQAAQPVEAAGIDVAARYRPSSRRHLVGGDWYDTVLLPDKNVLLAVGDVAGHGIGAVTGMVALRNHLRGLAVTGVGPGALLTWLNSAAFHLAGVMATAICGIYEPHSRTLRWARAGHLPPLIVRDGTASIPPPPSGVLLGADPDARYQEATVSLRLGDAVVLFTDGLIERRDQPLDNALEHLARLAGRSFTDIGQFADHLLGSAPSDTGDDICLVAVSIRLSHLSLLSRRGSCRGCRVRRRRLGCRRCRSRAARGPRSRTGSC